MKTIYAHCDVCGNESGYDKESLKGSTWIINGIKIVLCIPCEDDLLKKIAKCRGLDIKYGDGGEIDRIKVAVGIKVIDEDYDYGEKKINRYKVTFEFETDMPLDHPEPTVKDILDCKFDNLENLNVKVIG